MALLAVLSKRSFSQGVLNCISNPLQLLLALAVAIFAEPEAAGMVDPVAELSSGHGASVLCTLLTGFRSLGSSAGKVVGFQGFRDSEDYVAAEKVSQRQLPKG